MFRYKEDMINTITKERQFFMGLAILLVLIYHTYGWYISAWLPHWANLLCMPIGFGYIGVDIFLFYSALGLCYSIEKHSLIEFYKRRAIRILPLLFVLMVASTVIHQLKYGDFTWWDYVCNFTTLSYWHIGGSFVDWYLCALVMFYLMFPLLYRYVGNKGWHLFVAVLLAQMIFMTISPPWDIDCFISRWPIFLLGIYFYKEKGRVYKHIKSFTAIGLLFLFVFLITHNFEYFSRFLMTAFLAPCLIVLTSKMLRNVNGGGKNVIALLGKYTLELYVANCIALRINMSCHICIWLYLLISLGCPIILYFYNQKVKLLFQTDKES